MRKTKIRLLLAAILCGYVLQINGDSVEIDQQEYVDAKNQVRIKELGLSEEDLVSGYYLRDVSDGSLTVPLSPAAEYQFIDWGREYVKSDVPEELEISTGNQIFFRQYLSRYEEENPGVPFFFDLDKGTVVRIWELPMA